MSKGILMFRSSLPRFRYHKPRSLRELLEIKSSYGEDAAILAGGTDLLVDLKMGIKRPKHIIDIKGVKELEGLEYNERVGLRIGAAVTLSAIENSSVVKDKYYVLWDAVRKMGDIALRSRATLAGNIANASPAADSAPALLVYGASVELASVKGRRIVPLKEFFTGVKKTVVRPDEVIVSVRVPKPPRESRGEYFKAVRSVEDLALVGIAVLVSISERIVRLAYASVAPTPVVIDDIDKMFSELGVSEEFVSRAVEVALSRVSPITDVRASREYRLHLIKYMTAYLLRKHLNLGV